MKLNDTGGNPLLAIVGMTGAGKSSVARYLKGKGWRIIRFGEITIREVEARGLPVNEANERAVREELREKHGMEAYAKLLLPAIKEALASGPTVIDGLYSWDEYRYLRQHFGERLKMVAVIMSRPLRYVRLSRRIDRPLTSGEAEQRDFAEIENVDKAGPIAMADYFIINDGTKDELFLSVDSLLSKYILE